MPDLARRLSVWEGAVGIGERLIVVDSLPDQTRARYSRSPATQAPKGCGCDT
jgi:hypothetical protein